LNFVALKILLHYGKRACWLSSTRIDQVLNLKPEFGHELVRSKIQSYFNGICCDQYALKSWVKVHVTALANGIFWDCDFTRKLDYYCICGVRRGKRQHVELIR